jgi:hypothetical protein
MLSATERSWSKRTRHAEYSIINQQHPIINIQGVLALSHRVFQTKGMECIEMDKRGKSECRNVVLDTFSRTSKTLELTAEGRKLLADN